jgi:hypothetical protein
MRAAEAPCRIFSAVPFGNMGSAPAAHCSRVLRVHCRVARAVSIAYELPEVEPIIVRYFSPALPTLVQRHNIVETLPSGVCKKMRFLQAAPAKPG